MDSLIVIPARLASTRLPGKVLRPIAGKPMVQRVYQAAVEAGVARQVIVATDSDEVLDFCRSAEIPACRTSARHRSGTDRVHEVAQQVAADVYVNLQGDEPLARPEHLRTLLALMEDPNLQVGTLKTPCPAEDVSNPNAVKVVTDAHGRALYFSRSAIPCRRDPAAAPRYFKHLGFYAYRRQALERFVKLPESSLERSERLEQLRFLEDGIDIYVAETPFDTVAVDTEADLARVEEILRRTPRA